MADFKHYIARAASGQPLGRDEARDAFDLMMSGEATPSQIGGFLMALRVRGETVDEITGAVETMRAKMLRVAAPEGAIDIVGTGGDASGSYNVSTCAALIAAGAGARVAKHGNRSLSSKSGAADALRALGVNIDIGPDVIARCIREAGVGFMFAPSHHSAMRHVGPSRVELGTRTIFNLLGPLSNPAGVTRQLVGVFSPEWVTPIAHVLQGLGLERAWVVHGGGLDEMTTTGETLVAELREGKVTTRTITPAEAGLSAAPLSALLGGAPEENAAALKAVLDGTRNAYRDIAVLNAAGGLVIAGLAPDLDSAARLAEKSIDDGAARTALDRLVAVSNGAA